MVVMDIFQEEVISDRSSLIPAISNFACSKLALRPLELQEGAGGLTKDEARLLSVSAETLVDFCSFPLEKIHIEEFVENLSKFSNIHFIMLLLTKSLCNYSYIQSRILMYNVIDCITNHNFTF